MGAEGAGGGEKLFAHSVTFSSVCHMPGTVLEAPDPEDLRRWACGDASNPHSESRGQRGALGPLVESGGLWNIQV